MKRTQCIIYQGWKFQFYLFNCGNISIPLLIPFLNDGESHSKLKKIVGVVTFVAFISDKRKTFTATTEGDFTPVKTAEVSTLFGPTDPVEVTGDAGTVYVFPGGLNVSMLPFAVPQLTLGSVFGTDLTVRYFAYSTNEDIGKLNLFSWGLRHSISQYVPVLPLDLAVDFYSQQFRLGTLRLNYLMIILHLWYLLIILILG